VICAKLAYMNSLALIVGASNIKLVLSMMRVYRDIGIERMVSTELRMAKFAKGEKQCHFSYDG